MKELPVNQVLQGHVLDVLAGFPSGSVDLVLTSPPYWGLRSYGKDAEAIWGGSADCEHEFSTEETKRPNASGGKGHKQDTVRGSHFVDYDSRITKSDFCVWCGAWRGQLGLEPHPSMFIEHLVSVCREIRRVLKRTGSFYLNMGDTYGTHTSKRSGQFGKDIKEGFDDVFTGIRTRVGFSPNFVMEKNLLLIPSRVAIALQTDGWILRNDIVWHKRNHMPSSVRDRLTNSWEHLFHFVKNRKYFYDLDAIRKPHKAGVTRWGGNIMKPPKNPKGKNMPFAVKLDSERLWRNPKGKNPADVLNVYDTKMEGTINPANLSRYRNLKRMQGLPEGNLKGKNPSDFLSINTKPFKEAHFATFPPALCEMPIKAACPRWICRKCGKPRIRISRVEKNYHFIRSDTGKKRKKALTDLGGKRALPSDLKHGYYGGKEAYQSIHSTVGFIDCGCNAGWKSGIVLDPFCGAGTTLVTAHKLCRRWIGIDIVPSYVEMAKARLKRECSQKLSKFAEAS